MGLMMGVEPSLGIQDSHHKHQRDASLAPHFHKDPEHQHFHRNLMETDAADVVENRKKRFRRHCSLVYFAVVGTAGDSWPEIVEDTEPYGVMRQVVHVAGVDTGTGAVSYQMRLAIHTGKNRSLGLQAGRSPWCCRNFQSAKQHQLHFRPFP